MLCLSASFFVTWAGNSRKIQTTLPTLQILQPKWPNRKWVRAKDAVEKRKQAFHYNKRHGVRPLAPLQPGGPVLTRLDNQRTWSTPAEVAEEGTTERSYVIVTEQGALYRRRRRHLQALPDVGSAVKPSTEPNSPDTQVSPGCWSPAPKVTPNGLSQTRSGRVVKPVQKLDLWRTLWLHCLTKNLRMYWCDTKLSVNKALNGWLLMVLRTLGEVAVICIAEFMFVRFNNEAVKKKWGRCQRMCFATSMLW